ncbi:MAG: hypothetical protein AKCLJLPJ_01118 [Fimbriimonadales bacterium]|nr:MAG: hypothetical protein EDM73_05340 [Armatimonadota bacterium]MBV6503055.1 hypothetical protein [Fimbriimonadales bacterium]MCE7899410.1 hypothetical protein [Armatimonadetes bacterium ATM1]MDL1927984.1 flagellar protein FlgN [Fimbriimonadia bacterium ATM]MBC6969251.1 hypothetical protein [Armatimonadota bacterium]
MKTKQLQACWWDYLSTSERLLRSLHEQTAAVVLRDVERVERLQPEIERLLTLLQAIDDKAVTSAKELAGELGVDPNFRSLVNALSSEEQRSVHALANRVKAAAQSVQAVIQKNQALIENELAFVSGSLHVMARAAENHEGQFGQKTHAAVLVDERA